METLTFFYSFVKLSSGRSNENGWRFEWKREAVVVGRRLLLLPERLSGTPPRWSFAVSLSSFLYLCDGLQARDCDFHPPRASSLPCLPACLESGWGDGRRLHKNDQAIPAPVPALLQSIDIPCLFVDFLIYLLGFFAG